VSPAVQHARGQRLTGFDAGFLYQETPSAHMHTLKIAVLDPSTVPGGYSFQLVHDVLASRIHLLPPFTRRIVPIPWSLHHPVWIEDPAFDLSDHLFLVRAAAPGGPHELGKIISDVAGRGLDRRKPLWEIHVVEGLERGRIACIAKVHHTLADGVSSAEMLMAVMGDDGVPDSSWLGGAGEPVRPEPQAVPSGRTLVVDALLDLVRLLITLPRQLARTARGLAEMRRRTKAADVAPPRVFSGPRTSFNRALSPERIFAFTSLDLDEAKRIKNLTGTTLNDVVMAICAGALRRYLADRGEPVDRPLVAGVPVSTRTEEQRGTYGNRVSNMFTSVPADLADPLDRLRAINAVNQTARAQADALAGDSFEALNEYTPPPLTTLYARLMGRLRIADRTRSPINLVISNVPGPSVPLSIAGARLEAIYSVGPILEGIGLNITMWSYLGQMNFGLLSSPTLLPDLWRLAELLPESMAELLKAAEVGSASA
jgi:diacylglycerol O-acyltransferase